MVDLGDNTFLKKKTFPVHGILVTTKYLLYPGNSHPYATTHLPTRVQHCEIFRQALIWGVTERFTLKGGQGQGQ